MPCKLNNALPVITLLVGLALPATVGASDWPTFRGPNRTGVSKEKGLLQEWPVDGPALEWEIRGTGRGYASLAIVGDKIFTLGDGLSIADDKDEYLICLDRATGKLIWKTKTGPAWEQGKESWQSSRSTPTIDGKLLYVLTPAGELICCEVATGNEVWRKSMEKDLDGKKGDQWGYSESVLIDGDLLICTPGGTNATMVALDKKTGEPRWKCVREDDRGAGHASIVVANVGGERVYVQTTASGALGVQASDGKLLWSHTIDHTTAVIPTPIVRGDLVFFAAGYGRGGTLLKQVPDGDGGIKVEEIYPLNTELANKHGGIILVGDYLYGDSSDAGVLFCAELMTGKVVWKKRGSGRGSASIAAADGCLYVHFADGTVALAKATPDDYVETGSFKAPGNGDRPSWAHPVILDGKLYVREQDTLSCYAVRAGKAAGK